MHSIARVSVQFVYFHLYVLCLVYDEYDNKAIIIIIIIACARPILFSLRPPILCVGFYVSFYMYLRMRAWVRGHACATFMYVCVWVVRSRVCVGARCKYEWGVGGVGGDCAYVRT